MVVLINAVTYSNMMLVVQTLKMMSHDMLHHLWSADLWKSFPQLLVSLFKAFSIDALNIYFFSIFFRWILTAKKVWGYTILLTLRFNNFIWLRFIFIHSSLFIQKLYPFNDQCSHHTETSQLICRANQLTGFYMIGTLVVKGLKNYHYLPWDNVVGEKMSQWKCQYTNLVC